MPVDKKILNFVASLPAIAEEPCVIVGACPPGMEPPPKHTKITSRGEQMTLSVIKNGVPIDPFTGKILRADSNRGDGITTRTPLDNNSCEKQQTPPKSPIFFPEGEDTAC